MNSQYERQLKMVLEQTFESLAFMFPLCEGECGMGAEPMSAADSCPEHAQQTQVQDATRAAWVTFAGPFCGAVLIEVGVGLPPILTAGMLGLEDGQRPSDAQQDDALKELLNVVCGNLLPVISDSQKEFTVHAPALAGMEAKPGALEALQPACQVEMLFDGGRARATLLVDKQ